MALEAVIFHSKVWALLMLVVLLFAMYVIVKCPSPGARPFEPDQIVNVKPKLYIITEENIDFIKARMIYIDTRNGNECQPTQDHGSYVCTGDETPDKDIGK